MGPTAETINTIKIKSLEGVLVNSIVCSYILHPKESGADGCAKEDFLHQKYTIL